jgi:hypothetical protein
MKPLHAALAALPLALVLAGCGTQPGGAKPTQDKPAATASSDSQTVKSRDGSYTGTVTGKPVPNGKFAQLKIGMDMQETQKLMGRAPDMFHTYESGKRWIPFYFGNDARRMQALYKGEGCLIFTGGNAWGMAGGDLIEIHHDGSGACYQP